MKCSRGDLEVAIGILEGYIEKEHNLAMLMAAHLSLEGVRKEIVCTFLLAAESMKAVLRASEGLVVSEDREASFFFENKEEERRSDLQKIEELLNISEEERRRELEIILEEKRKELEELKKELEIKEEEVFSIAFCLGKEDGKTK